MGLINGKALLQVGVQPFDDDHARLIGIINQLHEAIKAGNGNQATGSALSQLADFAASHFRSEEALLQEHGYPELESHRLAHHSLLCRLALIQNEFAQGESRSQESIMQFLLDWLTLHIKNVDRRYGPYLNSRGIS